MLKNDSVGFLYGRMYFFLDKRFSMWLDCQHIASPSFTGSGVKVCTLEKEVQGQGGEKLGVGGSLPTPRIID